MATAVEQAADGIVITDPNGVIQFVNSAFTATTGYSIQDVVGKTPRILRSGRHSHAFYEELWNTIRAGRIWQGKLVNRRKDGTFYTEEMRIAPIIGPDRNLQGYVAIKRDVTAQNTAEESRLLLSTVVESSEDAIVSCETSGRIATWNQGAESIFGYSAEEAVGKHLSMVLLPEGDSSGPSFPEQILQDGSASHRERLAVHRDGRTIQISVTTWPILDSLGEVTAVSMIARDVSKRRKAEEARALLASIVESSDDAIYVTDLEGTVISWNRGAEKLCGLTSGQILGKNISILVPVDKRPLLRRDLGIIGQGHTIRPFDALFERSDGSAIDVSLSISPIRNSDGEVVGASAIARDISQRVRLDRELREASAKYRGIFDGAIEGMFQVSPEGKFLAANPALAAMLGYKCPEEMLSTVQNTVQIVWVDQDERARFLQALEEHQAIRRFECQARRRDGGTIWTSLSCRKVSAADGSLLYYEGFIEDITDRRHAEDSLRESGDFLEEAQSFGAFGYYVLDIVAGLWTSSSVLDGLFGIGVDYERTLEGWAALIHPDDRLKMTTYFADEVAGKGNAFEKEYRIVRHNDHEERWVHGIGKLEFDAQEKPLKMRGIIKDITDRKQTETQLRDSEDRYRSTFEQAAVGIAHTSFDGRFMRCNARFAEIIGYPLEEVPGLTANQITAPEDLATSASTLQKMADGTIAAATWEKHYIRKDGSLTWVKITVSTQRDAEGRALHSIALVEDINEWKAAEERLLKAQEALRTSEARYRTVFQTSLDCIMISRMSDGQFIDVNRAFLDLMGFEYQDVIGRTLADLDIWANPAIRHDLLEGLSNNSDIRNIETQIKKKKGELFWAQMSASVIEIEGISCVLCVIRNISEAKAAEIQIRNLAFYDPLTELPNRRLLLDRLLQTLNASSRTGRMAALLFVDLDNFKTLNDTLGHHAGDMLLQHVARRITDCLRESDTVARLGGDEFVVLLEGLSEHSEYAADEAKTVAEKILAAVRLPYVLDGRECLISSSIGITVFWDHLENADDVLQKAELAMYQAKAAGRDTIRFFAPALQAAVNARAAMEEALRQAIKRNQFLLYYQPQVDRGSIVGAEALIRWQHPVRGILAPGEFILLAEETGLILPLGDWVLETACKQIAAWAKRKETAGITLAINISARQFRQPDFVQTVLAALQRTGAPPKNLKLELTESMLLDDVEDVITKMAELKAHGLKFSLDDFGTGYSSLSYLKRLPLDQLKIDRSFVQDVLTDSRGGAIAQAIIALGRAMGMSVIAEGVETEEQRVYLAGLDCHLFQGYLFSPPRPLKDFQALLPHASRDLVPACR